MEGVWCCDICEYSRHCMYGKKEIGKDPENCGEYYKLEKYAWDAYQDRCAEEREEPEDDDDWEE